MATAPVDVITLEISLARLERSIGLVSNLPVGHGEILRIATGNAGGVGEAKQRAAEQVR